MNLTGYIAGVQFHLQRLGVPSRPADAAYVEAWNNQIPVRKMAENYKRRLNKVLSPSNATTPSE